jgi:hypothetical protein
MRRPRILLLGCVGLWLLICATPAWSILIETAQRKRVGGHIEREDATTLVLRTRTADGKTTTQTFKKANIKIIHRIDVKRLEQLKREEPAAYRSYAEELAEQKADPEAIELALRLYVIAAYLDPQKLGRRCLLSMSDLAPTSADARKYRAMALLVDPTRDESLLKKDGTAPQKVPDAAWQAFASALRAYRNGDALSARNQAQEEGVKTCFRAMQGSLDHAGFIQACTDTICPRCKYNGRNTQRCPTCQGSGGVNGLPCATCMGKGVVKCPVCNGAGIDRKRMDQHLEAIIRCELWDIDRQLSGAPAVADRLGGGTWSSAINNPQLVPVPLLTLENISDYDPRKCIYRNGAWVAP